MRAPTRCVRVSPGTTRRLAECEGLDALTADPRRPEARRLGRRDRPPANVPSTPITALLGLHPLIAEDILERNQRAKIEVDRRRDPHRDVRAGLRAARSTRARSTSCSATASCSPSTSRAGTRATRHQLRGDGSAALLERGPDFLLWAIIDGIVDGYFPVLDKLGRRDRRDPGRGHRSRPTTWTLERLFELKRELIASGARSRPSREIFNQLTNRDLAADRPPSRSSTSATCTTT